jgi:hypothetical protein
MSHLEDHLTPGGTISVPSGWVALVDELHAKLVKIDPNYRVSQVKEKFGELRFYVEISIDDWRSREFRDTNKQFKILINEAEKAAYHTCCLCGQPGELTNIEGWYAVLCDEDALKELGEEND